jgi:hypothetical protein
MSPTHQFPFNDGASHVERAHPHIVQRLRFLWGYPEGGRYLAQLIIDGRGGRRGFSKQVMSELLTLANMAANPPRAEGRAAPFQPLIRRGEHHHGGFPRHWGEPSLQPISYQPR